MKISYDQLHAGMNTDDLCNVWLSFINHHGLQTECDECNNDAAELREYLTGAPVCEWLDRFIAAWCQACDVEWRMGHGIAPHHGWTNHFEDDDVCRNGKPIAQCNCC
jgi:hypothetical protein